MGTYVSMTYDKPSVWDGRQQPDTTVDCGKISALPSIEGVELNKKWNKWACGGANGGKAPIRALKWYEEYLEEYLWAILTRKELQSVIDEYREYSDDDLLEYVMYCLEETRKARQITRNMKYRGHKVYASMG